MYNYDSLTVLANLAEIPGISIPSGEIDGIPVGMQLLAKKGNDEILLKVGNFTIEKNKDPNRQRIILTLNVIVYEEI